MELGDLIQLVWSFVQGAWPWILGAIAVWFFLSGLQQVQNQLDDIQLNVATLRDDFDQLMEGLDHITEGEDERRTRYEREADEYTRDKMPARFRRVLEDR